MDDKMLKLVWLECTCSRCVTNFPLMAGRKHIKSGGIVQCAIDNFSIIQVTKYPITVSTYITYIHNYIPAFLHNCIHTFLHTFMHTYIHTYLHTFLHTFLHTYIHTYLHTFLHTFMHTYIHTYLHTFLHTFMHTYIHTCLHTFLHTYLRTYVHTYIHTYIPMLMFVFRVVSGASVCCFLKPTLRPFELNVAQMKCVSSNFAASRSGAPGEKEMTPEEEGAVTI